MPATNVRWPVPLQRLTPWFPGQLGVPGTDHDRGLRLDSNGIIFWVDPNHVDAHDSRDGTNPDAPFATVAAALTHCRAYRGDVIAVMNNSDWTYGNTAVGRATPIREAVTVSTPGVRLVGLAPSGSLGVPWVPTANNAVCITVTAMDVLVEGFVFWEDAGYTGTTGILAQWDAPPYGDNITIRHCAFYDLAYGIQLDYSWYTYVEGCYFETMDTWAIHNPSVYGDPAYNVYRNNIFQENAGAMNLPDSDNNVIENNVFMDNTQTIDMVAGRENVIHGNRISSAAGGTNNMIDLTTGANNLVTDNWLSCTVAQYDTTCSDATSGAWVDNHCTNGAPVAPPT